jgi:predicted phosphodiesterase
MRVFALSDIHIDYPVNAHWVAGLSREDYRDDLLILAGDVSDSLQLLGWALETLAARFRAVSYVPGNHELWVARDGVSRTSFDKFELVRRVATQSGASMEPVRINGLCIVPLLSWYDYSFGEPTPKLREAWADYYACVWPENHEPQDIARHFEKHNQTAAPAGDETVISFSHFLPRIDVMPEYIPARKRFLYPVLGSASLDEQVRALKPRIHVYGHSHVNRRVHIDGITYVNNAFGYPGETRITAKQLLEIHSR